MVRGDVSQLECWRERLAKFESSGLTVAAFCRREKVTEAKFYYWSRRVRKTAPPGDPVSTQHLCQPTLSAPPGDPVSTQHLCQPTLSAPEGTPPIEILIGNQVTVRLPSSEPDFLVSILQSLQASPPVAASGAVAQGGFERIELGSALSHR